jgi:polar amino acid transport system substrate-binding protein
MNPRHLARTSLAAVAAVVFAGVFTVAAMAADPEPRQILAPSGKLMVGLYPGTPTSILPASAGEPRGVGYEVGKELARRLGVPYEPVVFGKNAEVLDAVKSGKVDAIFTNASAARAKEMDFSSPVMEIELGYLVSQSSPVAALADIDVKGRRIGVTANSSSDATLSRDLKAAEVVRATTIAVAIQMLSRGEIDAFATNKATLFEMAEKLSGSKVLDGHWGVERFAIGIPKGRDQGLPFVRKFAEEVRAEGLVKAAIDRAGLRGALAADAK